MVSRTFIPVFSAACAGVFTDEAAADRCLDGLPTTHPGFRGGKEKVAMNAVFTLTEGYQAMLLGEMQ